MSTVRIYFSFSILNVLILLLSACGVQQIRPDESGLKIVGGKIVVPNSWPWQAGLKDDSYYPCGGSLINDQVTFILINSDINVTISIFSQ